MAALALPSSCRRACVALVALFVAGCETAPAPGTTTLAQVIAVPRARAELGGGHAALHAAVLAGVARSSAEQGRLVLGECAEPQASEPDGIRWHLATTVLPEGIPATRGTLLDVADLVAAPGGVRHHGRFVALAPALEPAGAIRSPSGARLHTPCRPAGAAGALRMQVLRAIAAWELDFAVPEVRRRERFADPELAAGRVVMLSCQLKVVDGSDWYQPVWLARAPEGLDLRPGQVVTLRAGASEDSKEVEPPSQVLGLEPTAPAPPGLGLVRCR